MCFNFWGLVSGTVELGKLAVFFHKLEKNCKSQLRRDLVKEGYFESSVLSNSNISCIHFPFHESFI